ncbi:methyltransferase domain-containing protein [Streptomyces sp. NPDC055607]
MRPFAPLPPQDRQAVAEDYLDTVSRHLKTVEVREAALSIAAVGEGRAVLEVGCGLGDMARALARQTGPRGRVTATDHDPAMVAAAERRKTGYPDAAPVTYRIADAQRLPFDDASFDVVWCERVLQHVSDPAVCVDELLRVTVPAGRVCVIDVDWTSLRVGGVPSDVAAPVLASFAALVPGPDTAAHVPRMFTDAGLTDVTANRYTATFDLRQAASLIPLFDRDSPLGRTGDQTGSWFDLLEEADRDGSLTISLTTWITLGTAPVAERA